MLVSGHGVRGMARVKPYNPDSPLLDGCSALWLRRPGEHSETRFDVTQSRPHKRVFLVTFEGIESLNDLEPWIRSEVWGEISSLPPAGDGEIYHFEAIGLVVQTTDGETLGRVREVLPLAGNDVWVIESEAPAKPREVLLPVVGEIIREIDLVARVALVEPPRGLLED